MRTGDNIFRAVHRTVCKRCGTLISPGHSIVFDAEKRFYVHADCARVQSLVPTAVRESGEATRVNGIPHGLKPKSVRAYYVEWDRYLRFVGRRGLKRVPGKDAPWDLALVSDYMEWRAKTCKPTTLASCFSVLTHFGSLFGFLLPNSRDDDDSLSYRRLCNIKKQLAIDHVERSGCAELPSRCTPLGRHDVSLLLSTFGVVGRRSFRKLPRRHRHHLAILVMQHAQGMMFGHFLYRSYTAQQFRWDVSDSAFTLVTDWHRFSGRSRFSLRFKSFPTEEWLCYELRDADGTGTVVDTVAAATVLSWHFKMLGEEGETLVFAPTPGVGVRVYEDRAAWLRESLLAALPEEEVVARKLVDDVTPHSFRPGLAGDMRRGKARLEDIAMECRWNGLRNARIYSSRLALSAARVSKKIKIIDIYGKSEL